MRLKSEGGRGRAGGVTAISPQWMSLEQLGSCDNCTLLVMTVT